MLLKGFGSKITKEEAMPPNISGIKNRTKIVPMGVKTANTYLGKTLFTVLLKKSRT